MGSKAGITIAIKGEIDDLEAKISQSKEIINDATKSIISENNKLIASQEALNRIQKTYSKEIDNANNEIKKYLELKSQNGKLTKEEQQNLPAAAPNPATSLAAETKPLSSLLPIKKIAPAIAISSKILTIFFTELYSESKDFIIPSVLLIICSDIP